MRTPHIPRATSIVSKICGKMEQDKDAVALPETLDKKDQEETWDEPTPKGRQISLSLKKKCATSGSRFASPTKVSVLEKAAKGVVPGNTLQSTRWAVNTFITWAKQRNKRMPEEQIELDGDKYLPSSIRSLLSGIGRELADNKVPYNTLDGNDHRFQDLNCTLDTINSQLHHDGVGVSVKKAEVITKEVEQLCWDKGTLGISSPTVLQHTIFFYLGLHFVLRGVQEQHDLLVKQLQRIPSDYSVFNNSVYYEYTEFISKNNLHRFSDHRMKNKVVKAYAQPQSSHCLVLLLDNYLPLLPEDTLHVYMCPLQKFPCTELAPAYAKQRVGVNNLKRFHPMITLVLVCLVTQTIVFCCSCIKNVQ